VFARYFPQCYENRTDPEKFVHALSENYGDLNALHPFREGNWRTQREFARELCLECGYIFDLSGFQHADMLSASKLSFVHGDSSGLYAIFRKAVLPEEQYFLETKDYLSIHTLY
jgi:cell filamentation protein